MTHEDRMETRRWLKSYRTIKDNLESREKYLEEFIQDVYNPLRANNLDGLPKGKGYISDPTFKACVNVLEKYDAMLTEMQTEIEDLKLALKEIEIAINSLDGYEKNVCYHRFILGTSWVEIPEHIGYEQTQCTRFEKKGVEKICRKYMKNRLVG